jgi:hypothetical protein
MVAVNGKGNRQWKQPGAAEDGPGQKLPVMDAFLADDAKTEDGAKESPQVLKLK